MRASPPSPAADRENLEKTIFRQPLETVWAETRAFFSTRDPRQVERAERDPKHKLALVFRWYLGKSSHWANAGDPARAVDYQIWCGPAMASFNAWVKGSILEPPEQRRVVTVALNLLYGAAVLQRAACVGRARGCAPRRHASAGTPGTHRDPPTHRHMSADASFSSLTSLNFFTHDSAQREIGDET